MYTRGDLISLGFTKAQIEHAAVKGLLDNVSRLGVGGVRVFTAMDIVKLSEQINVKINNRKLAKLKKECGMGDRI